jgi:mono/diheme cytochrome c family protein
MILKPILGSLFIVGAATAWTPQSPSPGKTQSLLAPSMDGRDIYRFYCASCHGPDGRGDGPIASVLQTRPADLTRLAIRNAGTFPSARVKTFVTNGAGTSPSHGTRDMPVWGPTFRSLEPSDQLVAARIANVIRYVESIQGK